MGRVAQLQDALAVTRALLSGSEEHVAELTAEVKRLRRVNRELDQANREVTRHAEELLKQRAAEEAKPHRAPGW